MPDTTSLSGRLHGLYAITDETLIPTSQFAQAIEQALQGGVSVIQYRDKSNETEKRKQQATQLRTLCNQYEALLIINDDLELAKVVNADGVHLGEHDASISDARNQLGENIIIGVSCYNQIELALQAEKEGANYVAFGAFYSSPTKPLARTATVELLFEARQKISLPICAIGGINIKNAAPLVQAGADMVAVISGVFAADDVRTNATKIADLF